MESSSSILEQKPWNVSTKFKLTKDDQHLQKLEGMMQFNVRTAYYNISPACKLLHHQSYPTHWMFQLWRTRSHRPEMLEIKMQGNNWEGTFTCQAGYSCYFASLIAKISPLLNQACTGRRPACAWFLEIDLVRKVSVCVCLCVPPEASNNRWRDVAWYGPHMIG